MAVKKVTAAASPGVSPKRVARTKTVAKDTPDKPMTKHREKTAGSTAANGAHVARPTAAKATATKATATKVTATKMAGKASATRQSPAKVTSKKTSTKAPATNGARSRRTGDLASSSLQPQRLRVLANERPWTARELASVRAGLEADIVRLQNEISVAEIDLAGLMRDAGDGAGDDQADAGTATFEREQEISLANNARDVFEQSARALARLVNGSYGICESCGSPIGKNRLLAFPRATLCLTCKSKQERR